MFMFVLHFWLVTSATADSDSASIMDDFDFLKPIFRTQQDLAKHVNHTGFESLDSFQVGARKVEESKYPWIARVVHSRTTNIPHVCTASCINKGIFITAARCIYTLKVKYTSILYMNRRHAVRAFVFPSKQTPQMFDDIGFIVTSTKKAERAQWAIIELFDLPTRTDSIFKWFRKLNETKPKIHYRVVGYASEKEFYRVRTPEKKFELTELDVFADASICLQILTEYSKMQHGFGVPCYHACSFRDAKDYPQGECENYHGVDGGALFDTVSTKLIGIATWGVQDMIVTMPVGFATHNSDNFAKDYKCAKRILDDGGLLVTKGYYQKLCDAK